MSLETGQTLQNRYRIVSLLGQGGMGAVYRAWDIRLSIPVALKEMIPQPGLDPQTLTQLRQQFQQEATVLARLDHPHLVNVTDFFEEGGNAYLVMNFVAGESLADRIARQGALPERRVLTWADQLLDALTYCHSQGIIHRDVKPQNVIITPSPEAGEGRGGGQAVLVDFGLVKLWDPHDPRTRTAMRGMGTPEYAPPEQYDAAGHTDPRSDIYGLGATLYHALTGQSPPTATQRIVNPAILSPVRTLNPQVSLQVEATLARALELRPEIRFQNAAEMRTALFAAQRGAGRQAVSPPTSRRPTGTRVVKPTPPTAHRAATPWKWLVAGGAALVLVLLVGTILGAALLFGGRTTPQATSLPTAAPLPATEAASGHVPAATDTPLPSPTSPPPASATGAPQPTSTSLPAATPQPTATPLPTETPAPACPAVTGPFAAIWQAEQARLGCAANETHTSWMAQQHFEHGQMLWREDTDSMLAIHGSGIWGAYQDIWNEGDAEFSCSDSAPQESPPTPKRGFGKIWCTYPEVRSGLGWATDGERGFDGTVQDFEHGVILRTDSGATYALFDDNTWAQH